MRFNDFNVNIIEQHVHSKTVTVAVHDRWQFGQGEGGCGLKTRRNTKVAGS